jgi:SAM-dependent methyltransferase
VSPERHASNVLLRRWAATITGDVLSIGSSTDQDGAGGTYRSYFAAASSYTTSEVKPGCDLVLDVRNMTSIADGRYDALFVSGVLEHVDDVWSAVRECGRILKRGGWLLLGVPFWQPIHRAPQDFWRFTEYALRYLLRGFVIDDLVAIGPSLSPGSYWVKAFKA